MKEWRRITPFRQHQPRWSSPYYNESHIKFRDIVRKFVDQEAIPNVHKWDEAKQMPKEFFQKAAAKGLLPVCVGPPWPAKYINFKPEGSLLISQHYFLLISQLLLLA